ncbi:MAG TPA: PP2C family protein-serine/threonine phosphatase [Planctomycetota bacterium]
MDRILLEALADLSSTLELDEVLVRILARSLELSKAERALLLLDDGDGLQARIARLADGSAIAAEEVAFSTTVVQRALRECRTVTQETAGDDKLLDASQSIFELRLQSVLCAPLRMRDQTLGVIYLDSRVQRKTFSEADGELLEALARQAAIAVHNAHLLAEARERARMGRELELAAEIQRDLLPRRAPRIPGLDVAGRCVPCEEMSGDFYDFILLADGRLGLCVADVSGHGVGPALLAAEARGEVRALLPLVPDPGELLTRVHANLRETIDPGRFLTMFLAVVDADAGSIAYASAGHSEALLRRGGNDQYFGATGPPLGIDVDVAHVSQQVDGLRSGDGLLVYSDGLVEARDEEGTVFGRERLASAAAGTDSGAEALIERVFAEVGRFQAGARDDDRTAVVVLWK